MFLANMFDYTIYSDRMIDTYKVIKHSTNHWLTLIMILYTQLAAQLTRSLLYVVRVELLTLKNLILKIK